jgi:hypothetical protein
MPDLIAKSDLITMAALNSNVEDRKVTPGIEDAHRELRKILGVTGYDIVYAAAPTFASLDPNTAAYVTLLGYIKRWMVWRAKECAVPDMAYDPDKAGIYVKEGDEHRALRDKETATLTNTYGGRAARELELLLSHLQTNTAVFTWWTTTVEGEERITKQTTGGGFSLRKSTHQDSYRG